MSFQRQPSGWYLDENSGLSQSNQAVPQEVKMRGKKLQHAVLHPQANNVFSAPGSTSKQPLVSTPLSIEAKIIGKLAKLENNLKSASQGTEEKA